MLADNLIFLRNIKGLTQEQVAEVIGISRQSYSKWEQGETYPDIDKCDKLAKYYGVTIDSLVHQDNKVDDIKIAPAPIGKHLWGTVTIGSKGQIVIPKAARETFEHEKQKQEDLGLHCEVTIDGYTDFIFINRFGQAQHQAILNKAIRRIIRDCNDEQFLHSDEPDVLLPHFSCHSLRHTFTIRMCEAGVNIKVIQDALGHSDISTTLNIYADVTKEMKAEEFKGLDSYFKVHIQKENIQSVVCSFFRWIKREMLEWDIFMYL